MPFDFGQVSSRRYLVSPFVSALGASRSRQLAHAATLLSAEPTGSAELLLVATAREVRWLYTDEEEESKIVGAELYGPKTTDELTIWFATNITTHELTLINDLRRALSRAASESDGAPGCALEPLLALLDADRTLIVEDPATLAECLRLRSKAPRKRFGASRCEPTYLLADLRGLPPKRRRDSIDEQAPKDPMADDDEEPRYSKRSRLDDF